jgi:hypothetical protein
MTEIYDMSFRSFTKHEYDLLLDRGMVPRPNVLLDPFMLRSIDTFLDDSLGEPPIWHSDPSLIE